MFQGILPLKICEECKIEYQPTGGKQRFCKDCGILNEKRMAFLLSKKPEVVRKRRLYDRTEKAKIKYRRYRTTEAYRLYTKKRTKDDPLRYRAQYYLSNGVRDGKLIRPINCSECKIKDWGINRSMIEGHHYKGYEPKNWLVIKWLCTNCHKKAHGFKGGDVF